MVTATVNERPILFSAPMVNAILAGRKSQTRRIISPRHLHGLETDDEETYVFMHAPKCGGGCDYACASCGEVHDDHIGWTPWGTNQRELARLWVRESFYESRYSTLMPCGEHVGHWGGYVEYANQRRQPGWRDENQRDWMAKRPGIHMSRRQSRLTLDVARVRIERLQNISEEDALAEGFLKLPASGRIVLNQGDQHFGLTWASAREAFFDVWDRLNEKRGYSVASNPWTWAVTFSPV